MTPGGRKSQISKFIPKFDFSGIYCQNYGPEIAPFSGLPGCILKTTIAKKIVQFHEVTIFDETTFEEISKFTENCDSVIYAYSITDLSSFEKIQTLISDDLSEERSWISHTWVCCCKCDLAKQRKIPSKWVSSLIETLSATNIKHFAICTVYHQKIDSFFNDLMIQDSLTRWYPMGNLIQSCYRAKI